MPALWSGVKASTQDTLFQKFKRIQKSSWSYFSILRHKMILLQKLSEKTWRKEVGVSFLFGPQIRSQQYAPSKADTQSHPIPLGEWLPSGLADGKLVEYREWQEKVYLPSSWPPCSAQHFRCSQHPAQWQVNTLCLPQSPASTKLCISSTLYLSPNGASSALSPSVCWHPLFGSLMLSILLQPGSNGQ